MKTYLGVCSVTEKTRDKEITDQIIEQRIFNALHGEYKSGLISKDLCAKIGIKNNNKAKNKFDKILPNMRKKDKSLRYWPYKRNTVINFYDQYIDHVNKKWSLDIPSNSSDSKIPLVIKHTKDIQEKIILNIITQFKSPPLSCRHAYYKNMNNDEKHHKILKWGLPYDRVFNRRLNWTANIDNPVLLDDYLQNHASILKKMITSYNDAYADYWKYYYEIHDELRSIICKRTKWSISFVDHLQMSNEKEKTTFHYLTTNIQYDLFSTLEIIGFGKRPTKNVYSFPFHVEKIDNAYYIKSGPYHSFPNTKMEEKTYMKLQDEKKSLNDIHTDFGNFINDILQDFFRVKDINKKIESINQKLQFLHDKRLKILKILNEEMCRAKLNGSCGYMR